MHAALDSTLSKAAFKTHVPQKFSDKHFELFRRIHDYGNSPDLSEDVLSTEAILQYECMQVRLLEALHQAL